ncbi:MAG: hypothetical protein MUE42_10700 [Opitutaceae bacterium]|jgi:predicted phosphodiesterase|nr:hypothetical protein [Opitutaceae bacterium]
MQSAMAAPRIRIFSDLHFGDRRSTLDRLAALDPLLAGADEIVLNGDSLDTVIPGHAPRLAALRDHFAASSRAVHWISGNHDPDISAEAELLLAEGRVWITHGDVLFDGIAPWSHHAPELARLLANVPPPPPGSPAASNALADRLRRHRSACAALMASPAFIAPGTLPRPLRLLRTLFPPRRLLAILRAWRDTPRLAIALARRHHPQARVVVIGHTHRPGVWRPRTETDPWVINTGAFARPLGGAFVELHGERVLVRRIVRRAGAFYPGRTLADFTLPPPPSPAPL